MPKQREGNMLKRGCVTDTTPIKGKHVRKKKLFQSNVVSGNICLFRPKQGRFTRWDKMKKTTIQATPANLWFFGLKKVELWEASKQKRGLICFHISGIDKILRNENNSFFAIPVL